MDDDMIELPQVPAKPNSTKEQEELDASDTESTDDDEEKEGFRGFDEEQLGDGFHGLQEEPARVQEEQFADTSRRSERSPKGVPPERYIADGRLAQCQQDEPRSYQEAVSGP
ncbi:uncharacterized protein LOC134220779 [Armigeres subalbatus]|uniref:uncharacterized protein LOC134220779 n=1 Tax=Armigeres subalbatus TaxID=124917 RepID=UPI002ED51025